MCHQPEQNAAFGQRACACKPSESVLACHMRVSTTEQNAAFSQQACACSCCYASHTHVSTTTGEHTQPVGLRLQLLPPHTLLVVCLLACWLGREAICHADLIRGALLGHLPFLDMPGRCRDLMESPAGAALPISLMKSSTQIAGAVLCCAELCCTVLCCAVLCCAVLGCAVLCCAALRCDMFQKHAGISKCIDCLCPTAS